MFFEQNTSLSSSSVWTVSQLNDEVSRSLQMNFHELATCIDYNLPVKIFILNNGYLGMVRQLQQKFCSGRFSETKISNPDFVKLAESYGVCGIRVHTEAEILPALEKAFAIDGPVVVDFIIEPMEVV